MKRASLFARLGHLFLAVALLGATGAHWAVLQSVAWTTMIVENARSESLGTVVSQTLSGAKPCKWCKQIAAGKQSEKRSEFSPAQLKFEFIHSTARLTLIAPRLAERPIIFRSTFAARTKTPAVPPPRFLVA